MIKEILSTALLAVSFGGLKPEEPKNALTSSTLSSVYGRYYFEARALDWDANGSYFRTPLGNSSGDFSLDDSGDWQWFSVPSSYYPDLLIGYSTADATPQLGESYLHYKWYFENASLSSQFSSYLQSSGAITWDVEPDWFGEFKTGNDEDGYWAGFQVSFFVEQSGNVGFTLNNLTPTFSVNKTFNNCHNSGNASYLVPDTFTSSTLSNPYTIYVLANEGYFFKRDGSSYSFSSGVVVTNVDYGANPNGENLVYASEMKISFSMPASDVSMTFTAAAITLADANGLYNQGYQDARAIYENTNQFAWLKNIWTGMAGFFAIEILPNISLGFLCFSPLLVVAIIAIVRILKHD